VVQPMWFVGIYAVVTALTPLALAMDRRLGLFAALPALAAVAVVDLLRYGPWQHAMPGWLGLLNLLPGWSFGYLLGVGWARGRIARRGAVLLAVGGLALAVTLVTHFGYPVSMVGVPGDLRTNSHPPSLLVLALAAAQSGLAILLHDRLARVLARPRLWAGVALLNLGAMTVFCWHQVALMSLSGAAQLAGRVPGLHDAPSGPGWLLHRVLWFPVYALVLAGFVALARRAERPWRGVPRPVAALVLALAAGFGLYTLGAV
jgi:hypothetical protein